MSGEMTFTDDDLKRVKEDPDPKISYVDFPWDKVRALIARLEAAEDFIDITESDCDLTPDMKLMLEAWRKSKGE